MSRAEIVVHRNLGNRVSYGDLSSRSAIEWAVEELAVEHVVVCGHYDCGIIEEGEEKEGAHHGMGGWYRYVSFFLSFFPPMVPVLPFVADDQAKAAAGFRRRRDR